MDLFHLISILIVLSAGFAYINLRVFKLPDVIGLMLVSLIFSMLILLTANYFPSFKMRITNQLSSLNFSELLLEGMLSFMLFAGAIHIKYDDLKNEKLAVIMFSTVSVIISTIIIGAIAYFLLNYFGFQVSFISALLFGALISPTDPIAVLSILKTAGISKSLETKIAGESLFNDGVAVVVFITLLQLSRAGATLDFSSILLLFFSEAIGGLVLGTLLGWIGFRLIKNINNYQVEVLITLAIVMGGYTLAHYIHVSGPLAMVAAGLVTGNYSKTHAISNLSQEYIYKFWDIIDGIFNAILFVLIGLELLLIEFNSTIILLGFIFIIASILTRYVSLWISSLAVRFKEKITRPTLLILTWGGLRGGISIALALSIKADLNKNVWVTLTYIIVCFSILVQGVTVGKVARKLREGS